MGLSWERGKDGRPLTRTTTTGGDRRGTNTGKNLLEVKENVDLTNDDIPRKKYTIKEEKGEHNDE